MPRRAAASCRLLAGIVGLAAWLLATTSGPAAAAPDLSPGTRAALARAAGQTQLPEWQRGFLRYDAREPTP